MDIVEAVNQRKSIRAFKPDAVPQEILREIMELALRAPSWANTQPWEFAIAGGKKLEEIKRGFAERALEQPATDIPRTSEFPEPYDTRRSALATRMLEIKGIDREDTEKRDRAKLQGLQLFGAPSAIYILVGRSFYFQGDGLNVWPLYDCGSVAQNIMLLATKYGLGTIPQAQAVWHPGILRKVLEIPDSKLIVVGISIGYPDWDAPVNQFRSAREPLDKVAKWYGFD